MFAVLGDGFEREVRYASRPFTSFGSVVKAIETLLDRRARKNGVTRHLSSMLKLTGACDYTYPKHHPGGRLGFACRVVPSDQVFRLWIAGNPADTEMLVTRLNARESLCIAIQRSREAARTIRGTNKKRRATAPAVAGASKRLKRHFRNSAIKLDLATSAIAYALSLTRSAVREELLESLRANSGSVATIRRGRFVFRIEFPQYGRGLFDVSGDVVFFSTNDNGHRAYQRVRRFLRKRLACDRKKDHERQQCVLAARRYRQRQEILFRARM